jgi:hypothetical protein
MRSIPSWLRSSAAFCQRTISDVERLRARRIRRHCSQLLAAMRQNLAQLREVGLAANR